MGFITEWGAVGSADGEFQTPFGVGVGPDGSVVVADQGNQRVQVFDRNGVHWSTWDGTSAGADGLTKPNGLEVDARGVVYVTDEFGLVRAFDIEGGYRTRIGDLPNVLQVTSGAAAGLYPATSANFGPRTTAAGVSGSLSLVNDGTANPTLGCSALIGFPAGSVALVHSGGCAVTTKTVNAQAAGASAVVVIHASPGDPITMEGTQPGITISTVMVAQATGAFLSASLPASVTVKQNPSAAALIKPSDLAVSPDGTIYITDVERDRVVAFDFDGDHLPLRSFGSPGSGTSQFNDPWSIAVAPNGTIYVVDAENDRVQYFSPTTEYQGSWPVATAHGVAVAGDGTVYVVDPGNAQVQAFSPTGGSLGSWGSFGFDPGQFIVPFAVATGRWGEIIVTDLANEVLKFAVPSVTRIAGSNRYGTAAAVSALHHPSPWAVDTVFLATGANFPDALAGAVAAARVRAPLLLTGSIPVPTSIELDRLDPDSILILGGEAAIAPTVASALEAWGSVERLAGANRYETAIAISQHLYPIDGSADTVVIATGGNFADALAGASLAAITNGPILLTPTASLPQAVAEEVERLGPDLIIVLGGPSAVSSTVFSALEEIANTERVFGVDRYQTAVEIALRAFPNGAGVIYVAVGTNFPDALAGAAQAAAIRSPILLTPGDSLPVHVIEAIDLLDPYAVVILGGEAAISASVAQQLAQLVGINP